MPQERYFIDAPFQKGAEIIFEGEEFHHFARVMRGAVGSRVECVNGRGQLATATASSLAKHSATLTIDTLFEEKEKTTFILIQALPRFNRLEFILEKGTELGVSEFWLFPGERSEKETLSDNQMTRSRSLCIAAMKQCGRLTLPPIHLKNSLAACQLSQGSIFFGDVRKTAPKAPTPPLPRPISIFIGPESGFTDQEVTFLESLGAQGIHLNANILRVDTAAIAAIAILNN